MIIAAAATMEVTLTVPSLTMTTVVITTKAPLRSLVLAIVGEMTITINVHMMVDLTTGKEVVAEATTTKILIIALTSKEKTVHAVAMITEEVKETSAEMMITRVDTIAATSKTEEEVMAALLGAVAIIDTAAEIIKEETIIIITKAETLIEEVAAKSAPTLETTTLVEVMAAEIPSEAAMMEVSAVVTQAVVLASQSCAADIAVGSEDPTAEAALATLAEAASVAVAAAAQETERTTTCPPTTLSIHRK